MQMTITLNTIRTKKHNHYNIADMCSYIDYTFIKRGLKKETSDEGILVYSGDDAIASNAFCGVIELKECGWFLDVVSGWTWIVGDSEENILEELDLI